jgi:NADH dehydrogenase
LTDTKHHVVIIGGGFGGLYAAQALRKAPVQVTLIDKRNFHLFQPLLYQVATGGLSPADISSPLRAVLSRQKNTEVILGEVLDIDPDEKMINMRDDCIPYDTLILATGARHAYFGHDEWEDNAPGLKTIEDATEIRRRIFIAFEAAEREHDPLRRKAWLTFLIVGGGPTGVELAGALGELAQYILVHDFRSIDPREAEILLVEGLDRILPMYTDELSDHAVYQLNRLGVKIRTNTFVTEVYPNAVTVKTGEQFQRIHTHTILWAAGVKASSLGKIVADKTGAETDRIGRVIVQPDCTVPGHPDIFVIGDLCHFRQPDGTPLPGVAPVAMQQGGYVARVIKKRLNGEDIEPFVYRDKGSLAVIGRASAVADLKKFKFKGFLAWIFWLFVHLMYLVEFENRLMVFTQWAWNYTTRNRGARLITGQDLISLKQRPTMLCPEPPQLQADQEKDQPEGVKKDVYS